jgi:hypothetical protein
VLAVHKSRGIPYTIALDVQADASRAFGDVRVTPTSFLIDPDGRIVYRNSGAMDLENVRRRILDMLAKHNRTAPESGAGVTG